jgi:DNA-binding NarL/FixJ family response regulator
MKKSKPIIIFLLYVLIVTIVVALRDCLIAEVVIAVVGGGLLYVVLRNDEHGKAECFEVKQSISKEQYKELMSPYKLTKRELELGFMILSGYSNARIAEELYISESTVKKHVSHIYGKVGVSGRKEYKRMLMGK